MFARYSIWLKNRGFLSARIHQKISKIKKRILRISFPLKNKDNLKICKKILLMPIKTEFRFCTYNFSIVSCRNCKGDLYDRIQIKSNSYFFTIFGKLGLLKPIEPIEVIFFLSKT